VAREQLGAYTLGKLTTVEHPTKAGHWQARGYYRDRYGRRLETTASGTSRTAAGTALKLKVQRASQRHEGGDQVLNHNTALKAAAVIWLEERTRDNLSPGTHSAYQGSVNRVINTDAIGDMALVAVNNLTVIEDWLRRVADQRGAQSAKQARTLLSGILGLAERRGAIPGSVVGRAKTPKPKPGTTGDRKCKDPDCDYDCEQRHLDTKRAFTQDEVRRVLTAARSHPADIGDLALFLFTTGARIAEALHHTAWADVDIEAKTVRVRGTKSAQADRTLAISDQLLEALTTRAELFGTRGLVFGVTRFNTKLGDPRDVNNVAKKLKQIFKTTGTQWAGTHTFRRTVATWLDHSGASLAEIANQLGHSDINVTAGYLGRRTAPTRAAHIMTTTTPTPHLRAVK
jgi:integrase